LRLCGMRHVFYLFLLIAVALAIVYLWKIIVFWLTSYDYLCNLVRIMFFLLV
jgi:hypothetical protein